MRLLFCLFALLLFSNPVTGQFFEGKVMYKIFYKSKDSNNLAMAMINMFMPQKREILIKGGSYKTIMDGVIEAESYNHNTNLYSYRTSLSPNTTTIDASSNIDSVIKFTFLKTRVR